MAIIYGVDTSKSYGPIEVRDAIIDCFTEAHSEILEKDIDEFAAGINSEDVEKIKNISVKLMVKNYFNETGDNFENPTKESLIAVCDKLAEFARNFRADEIIKKHYREIMQLVEGLR